MNINDIIKKSILELEKAKKKYPDNKYPWNSDDFNIYQQCGLVALEAFEAFQAANKYHFNNTGSIEDIKYELIQTISTSIRVLSKLDDKINIKEYINGFEYKI